MSQVDLGITSEVWASEVSLENVYNNLVATSENRKIGLPICLSIRIYIGELGRSYLATR
jgi:hypothetical protein